MGGGARVVLVDERDRQVGVADKLRAHLYGGLLHRAFSVFVFDSTGRLLVQRRAFHKYHGGGLWSNTCCSHPAPGEEPRPTAERRLRQEMGFSCPLEKAFEFVYAARMGNRMTEREYDHVFVGHFDGEPDPDPREVSGWWWAGTGYLERDIIDNPGRYTPWFRMLLPEVLKIKEPARSS